MPPIKLFLISLLFILVTRNFGNIIHMIILMLFNFLQRTSSKILEKRGKWYGVGWKDNVLTFLPSFLHLFVYPFLLKRANHSNKIKSDNRDGLEIVPTCNSESQPTLGKGNISKCRTSDPMYGVLKQHK